MAKIQKPEEIFEEIVKDYKKVFENEVLSIILYGSATGKDYKPGTSDLNFLIVLSEKAIDELERAMETVSKWRKRNVATPLFMTKSYIESSLDSYPIEFLNMERNHILIYGEDVLGQVSCRPDDLRLQCEREIKGKLLLLRESFLETEGKEKRIRELIKASINAFISIFNGLLCLKDKEIPETKRGVIEKATEEFQVDGAVFLNCLDIKENDRTFSSPEIKDIFRSYLREVRKLWEMVDKLEF